MSFEEFNNKNCVFIVLRLNILLLFIATVSKVTYFMTESIGSKALFISDTRNINNMSYINLSILCNDRARLARLKFQIETSKYNYSDINSDYNNLIKSNFQ